MSKTNLKLLTFDAVNTIIKVNPCPVKQYAEAAKKFGMKVEEQRIRNAYENSWNSMKFQHPNYGRDSNMSSEEWWKIFITKVFKNAGYTEQVNASRSRMEAITNDLYRNFGTKDSWTVTDGIREILPELKAAGLKLGVVSNFDERLPLVLSCLSLQNYFDFVVTSISARAEKPDSMIFKHALKQAGVGPEQSIHIGDSLEEDFIPAKSVGIQPYLFVDDTKHSKAEVQKVVQDCFLVKSFKTFKDIILNKYR